MSGIQKYVLQSMMQTIAEKNDYDPSKVNETMLQSQSALFGRELGTILND